MKIRHYGKSWPSTLKIPLTEKENKFFRFLELSPDFEANIKKIRKRYRIPVGGFPTYEEGKVGLGIPKYLEDEKWNLYLEDEASLETKYGFVSSWRLSLSYFIKYNYMPKMADIVVPRAAIFDGDIMLQSLKDDYPAMRRKRLLISLSQKMSKKQLKELIDLQWDQIVKGMENLPGEDPKKHVNINLYKELAFLKEVKKMNWESVMATLGEKYPEDDRVVDEPYLRMLYSRYKTRLQKLPKPYVSLRKTGK